MAPHNSSVEISSIKINRKLMDRTTIYDSSTQRKKKQDNETHSVPIRSMLSGRILIELSTTSGLYRQFTGEMADKDLII
jgi:hypothetical protein